MLTNDEYNQYIIVGKPGQTVLMNVVLGNHSINVTNGESSRCEIKLSGLNNETFSGNACNCHNFWSRFKTAVHGKESLQSLEKFNYLSSSVFGLTLNEENYAKPIEILLQARFGRK